MKRKRTYRTGQIANHCGVTSRTVNSWMRDGKLKSTRLPGGGEHRVERDDLVDFLNENDFPGLETDNETE